jgi:hypothetical protein
MRETSRAPDDPSTHCNKQGRDGRCDGREHRNRNHEASGNATRAFPLEPSDVVKRGQGDVRVRPLLAHLRATLLPAVRGRQRLFPYGCPPGLVIDQAMLRFALPRS